MLISQVFQTSLSPTVLNPILWSNPSASGMSGSAAGTRAASATAKLSAASTSSTANGTARAASGGAQRAAGAAQTQATTGAGVVEQFVSSYPLLVGGKQYAESVEQGGGVYTASVASVTGASVSRDNEQLAEDSLGTLVDELV